jgi:hypothetical protein
MSHYSLAHKPLEMIPWAKHIAADIISKYKNSSNVPDENHLNIVSNVSKVKVFYVLKRFKNIHPLLNTWNFWGDAREIMENFLKKYCKLTEAETSAIENDEPSEI